MISFFLSFIQAIEQCILDPYTIESGHENCMQENVLNAITEAYIIKQLTISAISNYRLILRIAIQNDKPFKA